MLFKYLDLTKLRLAFRRICGVLPNKLFREIFYSPLFYWVFLHVASLCLSFSASSGGSQSNCKDLIRFFSVCLCILVYFTDVHKIHWCRDKVKFFCAFERMKSEEAPLQMWSLIILSPAMVPLDVLSWRLCEGPQNIHSYLHNLFSYDYCKLMKLAQYWHWTTDSLTRVVVRISAIP